MTNMDKKIKNKIEPDISKINAALNFAYCPSAALKINTNYMQNSQEFIDLSKGLDKESVFYMSNAMRYFYICYSLKLEGVNPDFEKSNYFYFQLFSQIGDQQAASQPVYGFFEDEKIFDLIKDIDSLFEPEKYNKQIFDSFQEEIFANASELIKLMQEWTDLKLSVFNNLYFKDANAVENLYKLIQRGRAISPAEKTKKLRKETKPSKSNNSKISKKTKNKNEASTDTSTNANKKQKAKSKTKAVTKKDNI